MHRLRFIIFDLAVPGVMYKGMTICEIFLVLFQTILLILMLWLLFLVFLVL